ncbi:MAG: hypothetical protein AAF968_16875 [Pseudomonadota bacterium]
MFFDIVGFAVCNSACNVHKCRNEGVRRHGPLSSDPRHGTLAQQCERIAPLDLEWLPGEHSFALSAINARAVDVVVVPHPIVLGQMHDRDAVLKDLTVRDVLVETPGVPAMIDDKPKKMAEFSALARTRKGLGGTAK